MPEVLKRFFEGVFIGKNVNLQIENMKKEILYKYIIFAPLKKFCVFQLTTLIFDAHIFNSFKTISVLEK